MTNDDGCFKSKFKDPDPKFVGIVSHEGYKLVSIKDAKHVSSLGKVTCTYNIDGLDRKVVSSIVFQGAKIELGNVEIGTAGPFSF